TQQLLKLPVWANSANVTVNVFERIWEFLIVHAAGDEVDIDRLQRFPFWLRAIVDEIDLHRTARPERGHNRLRATRECVQQLRVDRQLFAMGTKLAGPILAGVHDVQFDLDWFEARKRAKLLRVKMIPFPNQHSLAMFEAIGKLVMGERKIIAGDFH